MSARGPPQRPPDGPSSARFDEEPDGFARSACRFSRIEDYNDIRSKETSRNSRMMITTTEEEWETWARRIEASLFSFQDLFQLNAIPASVVVVVVAAVLPSQESTDAGHWGGEQTRGTAGRQDVYSWRSRGAGVATSLNARLTRINFSWKCRGTNQMEGQSYKSETGWIRA